MRNSITLRLPANMSNFEIIEDSLLHLGKKANLNEKEVNDLIHATRELVKNAVIHAYIEQDGFIEILIHPYEHGIRVDIRDWGVPMSKSEIAALSTDYTSDRGLSRTYALVDRFQYKNLGKKGKKFTIIKRASLPSNVCEIPVGKIEQLTNPKEIEVRIRDFREGDEGSIARLIYQNYGLSYAKEYFYYPVKILSGQGKEFVSIIAEAEGNVVGHFALILKANSNIAEIGVVVVDPQFKGMGIMNKMFNSLIAKAGDLKLSAIYGEAVMYHTFSQKSNLSHHFCESAIILGKTPSEERIESNELTQRSRRGSDLVGYYFFEQRERSLYLPKKYNGQILQSYQYCKVPCKLLSLKADKTNKYTRLSCDYNPLSNVGKIMIHRYGEDFKFKFTLLLEQLRAKHCDMIYADVNLEEIPQINKVIKILNKKLFFYSGVLFLKYHDQDYLRLQHKHSEMIGKKNLVCHSDYCSNLLTYILQDESEVKKNLKSTDTDIRLTDA